MKGIIKTGGRAIIVFIKNPDIGTVKTRIAKTTDTKIALKIYNHLLDITRLTAREVKAERYLFYSNYINPTDEWSEQEFNKHLQVKGDLGKKMKSAFELVLAKNKKAILIGSDCPYIDKALIEEAFDKLEDIDCVIGPAKDGGYYLIGLKSMNTAIFKGIRWSTDKVLMETKEKMQQEDMSYHELPILSDIDHWEDWEKFITSK